jgi:hypothetical protein
MKIFLCLLLCCLSAIGQPFKLNYFTTNSTPHPTLSDFVSSQFSTNGNKVSILNGATVSNLNVNGLAADPVSAITVSATYLKLGGLTNVVTMAVGGVLTLDGNPIAAGGTNTTNTVINATTVNVTSNVFNIGKGGHLQISSNLTVLQIGPSKIVRTDGNTNLAATTIGPGLAFDGTTLSATGGGTTVSVNATNVTTPNIQDTASVTWGVNGSNITATAVSSFVGIYRDQSIEAGAMFGGPTAATAGAYTNSVNDTLSDSWIFADAATQSARFALTLPDVWNVGTVTLKLYVTCDNTNVATTTNLVWGVKAGSLAPGEALTNAVFGTQVFVTNGLSTAGNVLQMFLSPAITIGGSPARGDSIWFDVSRQGGNSSDTWTNTPVRLLKARLQWLESSTAPSLW